ncbi:MAG: helix-turn-helix domain-containing protein [Chloroflexi bacterium]|nr:helix-turn-helix domain-containing protein [Chloroflexota bacterium]
MTDDSKIIDDLGGTFAVAAVLRIKPPSVSNWRKKGIPSARRQTLALLFPGQTPPAWRQLLGA